jgi:hypothetical protein
MTRSEKIAHNKAEKRIDAAYRLHCSGVEIDIMDIGKIFKVGRGLIAAGMADEQLGAHLLAYVNTIRKN